MRSALICSCRDCILVQAALVLLCNASTVHWPSKGAPARATTCDSAGQEGRNARGAPRGLWQREQAQRLRERGHRRGAQHPPPGARREREQVVRQVRNELPTCEG